MRRASSETAKAAMLLAIPTVALGQDPATTPASQVDEIIVTAQKREQSANTVGMSITAATDDVLQRRRITSVAELTRLVPGVTIQESSFNSTSFTLRGVGFFNSDLATPPAVTVYVDEAPLPYPAMSKLAAFDVAQYTAELDDEVYRQRVLEHIDSGKRSGVRGTPGFLLNGRIVDVSFGFRFLLEAVENTLHGRRAAR
jgi:hypothetical protein